MSNVRKIKEVESVTINFDNGWSRTIDVKKDQIVALFWGNLELEADKGNKPKSAPIEILGTYYDSLEEKKQGIKLSKRECEDTFGKVRADKIFKSSNEDKIINKSLIKELWNTPDGDGETLVYGGKGKICKISGG